MSNISQSIIMPYHKNKQMLLYTTMLLEKIVAPEVEIIIIGNNNDANELDIELSARFKYIKFSKSMLYSKTVNEGVKLAHGDIITLCDQDIFSYEDWYTPLLNKLLSHNQIGSVSSKLLNPINNRIIDFGIEYSKYRILHPLRGLKATHPLAMVDRKVTSTTSAILMMRRSTYLQVNGMDLDMPYCCSDCDIGIKIEKLGLENWVVANSVAYHRGSSSTKNGKSQSFSHLKNDSTCMFWAKNYYHIRPTIKPVIKSALNYYNKNYTLAPLYCFINLSSLNEYEWYAECLEESGKIEFSDIHSYPQSFQHYSDPIQIYDEVPYTFMNLKIPIIYFVDYFPALVNNQIWDKMRDITNDIVLDSHGNMLSLKDIINGKC